MADTASSGGKPILQELSHSGRRTGAKGLAADTSYGSLWEVSFTLNEF